MLRYVSRRIKDTVERTSNVLEARRTWTYGNEGVGAFDGTQCDQKRFERHLDKRSTNSIFEFGLEPKTPESPNVVSKERRSGNLCSFPRKFTASDGADSGSSSSDKEDFRERIHRKHHCKFQKNFVDALTWSSALICGWYTSQILCMKRRNLQNGWNSGCRYARIINNPSQAFHSSILSHWALAAPVKPSEGYVWTFKEESDKFSSHKDFFKEKFAEPVSNDHLKSADKFSNEAKNVAPKTFDEAVHNLLNILGDIEFQLGVASVQADRYDLAVSHFKLATSHCHASAAYNLGVCYEEGMGIEKNLKMALECYLLASSFGHAKALYNVGVFHARGLADLPKNRKAARQYFKEAARQGLGEANRALGMRDRDTAEDIESIEDIVFPKVASPFQPVAGQYQPVAVAI